MIGIVTASNLVIHIGRGGVTSCVTASGQKKKFKKTCSKRGEQEARSTD